MSKYIIKNCPCIIEYKNMYFCAELNNADELKQVCQVCQDCTDCVMKQIVEKCKKEIKIYRNTLLPDDGTNTLHFGRQSFAYDILQLLEIQELE